MKKDLLTDGYKTNKFSAKILSEARYDDRGEFIHGMVVQGIMQRANSINQNGRKYPKSILFRESNKYKKIFVAEKRSFGELDHPDSSIVSMQTASHWIQDLWWEGDDLYGKIELLDTPCGRIVESILKRGLTIGISSRGLGSVKSLTEEEDTVEVQDDFEIVAWDFVSNPSTQGAFMKPLKEQVLAENTNYKRTQSGLYIQDKKINKINGLITDILIDLN